MELNPRAFSADGYIIRQWETDTLSFGVCPNPENGCGWIAAYNLLRATLHPVPWQTVHRDLSRQLLFQGKAGVHLVVLLAYLKQQGCSLRTSFTLTGSRLLAEKSRAGILMYGTGHSTHYVTFVRQPDGRLRFLNVDRQRPDITLSLRDFYREVVNAPAIFALGVR